MRSPAQGVLRELPLCPYPQVIHYNGGDQAKAKSYSCRCDDRAFEDDLKQEQNNILTDALVGDLANLPN